MTRDECKKLVAVLKAAYTDPKFIPDATAFDVWYGFLKDISYEEANIAVARHIQTNRFTPTIADIRAAFAENRNTDMNEEEAWQIVYKAICNSGYHAEEEFERLPEVLKITVHSKNALEEWAKISLDELNTVTCSTFKRNFIAVKKHRFDESKISGPVMKKIEEIRKIARGETSNKAIHDTQTDKLPPTQ